jgi:hypothetical protein
MSTAVALAELAERATSELNSADPNEWPATETEAVLAASVRLTNLASHVAAVAARQVGATNAFRRTGDRSAAHYLARVAGGSVAAARGSLDTLALLDSLDATATAVRTGALSPRQAAAITGAAILDRSAEDRLLRMAHARGIGQLEDECARVRAAAAPADETERHRRARRERGCWTTNHRDGSAEIRFRSSSVDVAQAWATITAFRDRLFRDSSPGDDKPSFEQLDADGFMDMARAAACRTGAPTSEPRLPLDGLEPPRPTPQPAKIIVRIDWDALVRGYPTSGETSEIAGVGPVPVEVVRDLIATGDPFLAAVVTEGNDVCTVAHLGRQPSVVQRTALEWMCRHHHSLKTTKGWRLVPGKGIRPLVPPNRPPPPHPSRTHQLRDAEQAVSTGEAEPLDALHPFVDEGVQSLAALLRERGEILRARDQQDGRVEMRLVDVAVISDTEFVTIDPLTQVPGPLQEPRGKIEGRRPEHRIVPVDPHAPARRGSADVSPVGVRVNQLPRRCRQDLEKRTRLVEHCPQRRRHRHSEVPKCRDTLDPHTSRPCRAARGRRRRRSRCPGWWR